MGWEWLDCNPAGRGLYTASDIQGAATSPPAFIGNKSVMDYAIRFIVVLQKAIDNMSSTAYWLHENEQHESI
jgi:hypothetical protein